MQGVGHRDEHNPAGRKVVPQAREQAHRLTQVLEDVAADDAVEVAEVE